MILEVQRDSSEVIDYFVFNIVDSSEKAISYTLTTKEEFVKRGLNYDTNEFGYGTLIYKNNDGGRVYSFVDFLALAPNLATTFPPAGVCPSSLKGPAKKPLFRNCFDRELGFSDDSLFVTRIRYNYALWFILSLMILFFVITINFEPIIKLDFKNKDGTAISYYPLLSLWYFAHEGFTRTTRVTALTLQIMTYFFINALIINIFHPDDLNMEQKWKWEEFDRRFGLTMLLPIGLSLIVSTILGYLIGAIRLGLRNGHYWFLEQSEAVKKLDDV